MKKIKAVLNKNSTWTLTIACDQIGIIRYSLAEAAIMFHNKVSYHKRLKNAKTARSTEILAKEATKASEALEAAIQLAIHGGKE